MNLLKIEEITEELKMTLLSPEQTTDDAFTKSLCTKLREGNRALMSRVFKFLGRETSLNLYAEVYRIQSQGGQHP